MTTYRVRVVREGNRAGWLVLLPEAIWMAALLVLLAPGAYAIHFMRSHQVAAGLGMFAGWAVIYGVLLRLAHRRGWARIWFTLPVTCLLVVLLALVLR